MALRELAVIGCSYTFLAALAWWSVFSAYLALNQRPSEKNRLRSCLRRLSELVGEQLSAELVLGLFIDLQVAANLLIVIVLGNEGTALYYLVQLSLNASCIAVLFSHGKGKQGMLLVYVFCMLIHTAWVLFHAMPAIFTLPAVSQREWISGSAMKELRQKSGEDVISLISQGR